MPRESHIYQVDLTDEEIKIFRVFCEKAEQSNFENCLYGRDQYEAVKLFNRMSFGLKRIE